MDDHQRKLYNFVHDKIKDIKEINILEFGVREGKSTRMFIELAEKNNGNVISIDIDDYKNLFDSKKWKFIQSRDDNFEKIKNILHQQQDVILLDSFHEADHVHKIIINYYDLLKEGGYFFIDDISWLPYLKGKERDSLYCELNNKETFDTIICLYNDNDDKFDLEFSFISSGFAVLKKRNNLKLDLIKRYKDRKFSLRNLLRKFKNIKYFEKKN